ncbi:MAG: LytR/AlgR family response regulator transcription factor [Solirubrobacteraceae bacterium]
MNHDDLTAAGASRLAALVVDDERPAREDLGRLLASCRGIEKVTVADGGVEALRLLGEHSFDVVFLDVRMPEVDGLELAKTLDRFAQPPALVFVSAREEGAVGAFQLGLHPLDYLMKPVSRARMEQAIERVIRSVAENGWSGAAGVERAGGLRAAGPRQSPFELPTDEIIPVEHQRGGGARLLDRSTVLYVKAQGDYVRMYADAGRFLVRASLADIEQRWGQYGFVRVHRSYVANLRRATEIRPALGGAVTIVMADGSEVPVARRQVAELRRRLRM